MADESIREIDEQVHLVRQRFEQVTGQIRTVLVEDVSRFVEREAKKAFLAHPEGAEKLSDTQISDLKHRARRTGEAAAKKLDEDLLDLAPWSRVQPPPEDPRSLTAAESVWGKVRRVEDVAAELLREFGLGHDTPRYKAPVYFVSGLYLPSLVEHYWKLLGELSALEEQKESIVADATRDNLLERWKRA